MGFAVKRVCGTKRITKDSCNAPLACDVPVPVTKASRKRHGKQVSRKRHDKQVSETSPSNKFWPFVAFAGVDGCAAALWLENFVSRLRKQWRMHVVNLSFLLIVIVSLLLWQAKFANSTRPTWLLGFEQHVSVTIILIVVVAAYRRFSRGVAALQSDWLTVQPIPFTQRIVWLRAKIAARTILELGGYSVLVASLCGAVYGLGVLVFGAGLSLLMLILLAHWQAVLQAKNTGRAVARDFVVDIKNRLANSNQTNAAPASAKVINALPFNTWFSSAIPRLSKLRWWWLLPLLSLPMGSNVLIIAAIFAGFLALTRFVTVCTALSSALAQISKLTHTTPLKPTLLYRAALAFSAQGALVVALISIAIGFAPVGLAGALFVALAGLLLLATALHFGFGYRLEPAGAVKNRAEIMIALLMGLTANGSAFLLPVVCPLLWLWLYRRGCRINSYLDPV